jgi:hypothetical protein
VNVVVFTGPTLSAREVSEVIEAVCLPPVSQGDVYRAALRHPSAIGIIDGYFEQVPSVWHKEILWAMSQGIHVFGSASMGALRAAELASFGMTGVGAIFEAYRDGVLEDDDEVAVAHGPSEEGYRGATEAMVNIRATLRRAREEGVLGGEACALLQRIAKELFYPERSYSHILKLADAQGAPASELDAFRRWLPDNAVNQKREDALAMLRAMRDFLETNPGPKQASYAFEETAFWHGLTRHSAELPLDPQGGSDAAVLEELRRDSKALAGAAAAALGWMLATEQARREGYSVDAAALLNQSGEFCRAHDLPDASAASAWLERNHCSRDLLDHILESRALALRAQGRTSSGLEACLLAYLRWTGDYPVLLNRSLKVAARS